MDAERVLLTTHVRPDGDGIASELALMLVLRMEGKKVHIVNHDRTPEIYRWLPAAGEITALRDTVRPKLPRRFDLAVLLDCSGASRIGSVTAIIERAHRIISVDHHANTDCYRDYCYINTEASSIGEIIYQLLPDPDRYLNREVATLLYTSILWDTGSFAYSNTSAKVFKIVSRLLEHGVDPSGVYRQVFSSKSLAHFRLLGESLKFLRIDTSGRIASLIIPLGVYQRVGARDEDNEGILEVLKGLKETDLIIFLRQLSDTQIKCSLRSVNRIDCSALAALYGGGGHQKASGFVIEGDVESMGGPIVDRLIAEVHDKGWI
jgi:phosphoesterase RecJ-like protein